MSRCHAAADTPEALARRIAGRKLGFFIHATVFVLVNAALIGLNLSTGRHAWSAFPLLGWGLGLAVHALTALGPMQRWHEMLTARERTRIAGRG